MTERACHHPSKENIIRGNGSYKRTRHHPRRGSISVAGSVSARPHHNPIRGYTFDEISEIGHIGIGTHVYVLAGGLALAGVILGFTNWALDVPPKFFRPQPACNFSTTAWATPYRRRAMARLYTPSSSSCCRSSWRGWHTWWGNGDGTVSATILKAP